MKVTVETVDRTQEEEVRILCWEITPTVRAMEALALRDGETVTGFEDEMQYAVPVREILYFEAVDEHVFAYTANKVLQVRARLYELAEAYVQQGFFRCSKSVAVNLMHIDCIQPSFNGRFLAVLQGGEKLIVSRQYVPALKKLLMGEGE